MEITSSLLIKLIPLFIWVILWKGIALWKAVKNDDKKWFVVMMVVQTLSVLEILYVLFFSKKGKD